MTKRHIVLLTFIAICGAFVGSASAQSPFTRTYTFPGTITVGCCSGYTYGFTQVVDDLSVTGKGVQINSISVSALGSVNSPDLIGNAGLDWEVFIGPSSFGLPVGQIVGSSVYPGFISSSAPTQFRFAEADSLSSGSAATFSGSYNFQTNTFVTNAQISNLKAASTASMDLGQGLFLQAFLWNGAPGSNIDFSGITITISGTTGWVPGDVFAAVGNGQYQVYHNTGTSTSPNYVLVETLTDGSGNGFTHGCAFDSASNLFTTNITNTKVYKFDANPPHSILQTIDTNAQDPDGHSESVFLDSSDNLFVGDAGGARLLLKYDPSGTFVTSFTPAPENEGPDWTDLSANQRTVFYTSEGALIKRFDVFADSQLSDFATIVDASGTANPLRLLPPFDGTGGLLVADRDNVKRLDGSGAVVQTYPNPGSGAANSETFWFALNLDPNGTSFWAGDHQTGDLYRFNIATGAVEVGPITTVPFQFNPETSPPTETELGGLCVKGEPAAVNSAVLTFPGGTTTSQVVTFNSGDAQNSHSWKAHLTANTTFSIVLTAHEVVCDTGVACNGDDFDGTNNYRCRWEEYFSQDPQLPIGIPYSHGNCVYYRVENPPPDSDIGSDILFTIGYNDPPGTPAGTPYCSTLTGPSGQPLVTRFFRDPSSPPPADAALNHSFAFDITQGSVNESGSVGDPTINGDTTKTFNDYAVACRATTGATALWLKPSATATPTFKAGSAINLTLRVSSPIGTPITDAATSPNSTPLLITGPGGVSQTLGTSPGFWTYDSSDNWYIATWKSPVAPTGTYTLCVNSTAFDYSPFPSTCTTLVLK
jgi:hypothetical protein